MRIFWPNVGRHRIQAHAVGLLHAIAAAFADFLVDHQANHRLRQFAARPLAALLGRALLVVDDRRHAGDLLQFGQRARQFGRGRATRHSAASVRPS